MTLVIRLKFTNKREKNTITMKRTLSLLTLLFTVATVQAQLDTDELSLKISKAEEPICRN
jgi:hypothetical protein